MVGIDVSSLVPDLDFFIPKYQEPNVNDMKKEESDIETREENRRDVERNLNASNPEYMGGLRVVLPTADDVKTAIDCKRPSLPADTELPVKLRFKFKKNQEKGTAYYCYRIEERERMGIGDSCFSPLSPSLSLHIPLSLHLSASLLLSPYISFCASLNLSPLYSNPSPPFLLLLLFLSHSSANIVKAYVWNSKDLSTKQEVSLSLATDESKDNDTRKRIYSAVLSLPAGRYHFRLNIDGKDYYHDGIRLHRVDDELNYSIFDVRAKVVFGIGMTIV